MENKHFKKELSVDSLYCFVLLLAFILLYTFPTYYYENNHVK